MCLVLQLLFFEIEFHSIRRPCGNSASEEILIFRPNGDFEQQCHSNNRPVVDVANFYASTGSAFMLFVEASIYTLDHTADLLQDR